MCALAAALAALAVAAGPPVAAPVDVRWIVGPVTVELAEGDLRCAVPAGVALAAGPGARSMLEVVARGSDGSELAVLSPVAPSRTWFVVLARRETPAPEAAAPPRADRRDGPLVWLERPRRDARTGRTSWALAGPAVGGPSVNRHVWLPVGDGGVEATLVAPVEELAEGRAQLERILAGLASPREPPGGR